MTKELIKVLLPFIDYGIKGVKDVDVLDVVYETSILYTEIKPYIDELERLGEIRAIDFRRYGLCGEPSEKLNRLIEQYPKEVFAARRELNGESAKEGAGNARSEAEESAAQAEHKTAYEKRREEFLRRLRERREAMKAAEEEEDDEDDDEDLFPDDGDESELDDDDLEDAANERISELIAEINGDGSEDGEGYGEEDDGFYTANCKSYSKELVAVIREAFKYAHTRNTDFVGSGHVVYAMLFSECKASGVLLNCSASRVYYGYYLRARLANYESNGKTFLNEGVKAALDRAVNYAEELGGEGAQANTVHMLKAIIEEPECDAVQCLIPAHTDMNKLLEEIEKFLRGEE